MNRGTFYGVGVGPGDPELLTLKAVRILTACPVIAVPRTKQGSTLAYDIASGAVDFSGKTLLPVHFTMSLDPEARRQSYETAAEAIMAHLDKGQDVAMLNLGDPSLYGTQSYILERIQAGGYATQVVSGVTSFCESAARLGVSLTTMEKPLHIIPAGYGNLDELLALPGSKVVMKASRGLAEVKAALRRTGRYDKTVLAERCALPDERLYHNLDDAPDDTGYFTTLLIRE